MVGQYHQTIDHTPVLLIQHSDRSAVKSVYRASEMMMKDDDEDNVLGVMQWKGVNPLVCSSEMMMTMILQWVLYPCIHRSEVN